MENRSLSIQRIIWYLAIATAFAFVVPILFTYLNTTDVHRIGIILFGIYVVYAVVVGLYAGKSNEHFWVLLFSRYCILSDIDFSSMDTQDTLRLFTLA